MLKRHIQTNQIFFKKKKKAHMVLNMQRSTTIQTFGQTYTFLRNRS